MCDSLVVSPARRTAQGTKQQGLDRASPKLRSKVKPRTYGVVVQSPPLLGCSPSLVFLRNGHQSVHILLIQKTSTGKVSLSLVTNIICLRQMAKRLEQLQGTR
jgi:hypothetical protein